MEPAGSDALAAMLGEDPEQVTEGDLAGVVALPRVADDLAPLPVGVHAQRYRQRSGRPEVFEA